MNISNCGNNSPDTESHLNEESEDGQEKDANKKFASWSIDFGRPKSACPSRFVSRPPSRLNTIYEVAEKQEKAAVKRAKKHLGHILKSEEKHEKTEKCKSFREQNEIVKKHQAEEKLNFKQIRAEVNRQNLKQEQAKKLEESSAKRTNVIVQKQLNRYDMFCVEKGESDSAKREREIMEKVLMREAANRNKLYPFSPVFAQSTPLPAIPRATEKDHNDKNENKKEKKMSLLKRIRTRIVGFFRRRNNTVGIMHNPC